MATPKKTPVVVDAQIISTTTAEQETNALIVAETEKLIETSITELRNNTATDEHLAHLKAEYGALAISGIEDLDGYKAVKDGAAKLKKLRSAISKKREELTAPALQFQRALISEENRIIAEIKPIEEQLIAKQKDYENAVEAKKREEYTRRVQILSENGFQLINGFFVCGPLQLHSEELGKITEVQLNYYVDQGKEELNRKAAEERRKAEEAERLKAEQEAIAAERAEIARMRAELEAEKARAEKERAELEAQKNAIEKTYDTVVQPVAPLEFELPKVEPAPEPVATIQQTPPPAKQPVEPTPTDPERPWQNPRNEFERGFNAFRVQLVALAGDKETKLTRELLTNWAWKLPPNDTKQ